jgi:hypothetical protein
VGVVPSSFFSLGTTSASRTTSTVSFFFHDVILDLSSSLLDHI